MLGIFHIMFDQINNMKSTNSELNLVQTQKHAIDISGSELLTFSEVGYTLLILPTFGV